MRFNSPSTFSPIKPKNVIRRPSETNIDSILILIYTTEELSFTNKQTISLLLKLENGNCSLEKKNS